MVERLHRVAQHLHESEQQQVADGVPDQRVGTTGADGRHLGEAILQQRGGALGDRLVVGQGGQGLPQVARGQQRVALGQEPAARPAVVAHGHHGSDVQVEGGRGAPERSQRGAQPVAAAERHHPHGHSRPRSRWEEWADRRMSRSWAVSSSEIATLRCLPPVQPTATVR